MNIDIEEFKKIYIEFKNKNGEKKYNSQFSQFDIIQLLSNNKFNESFNLYKNFQENKSDNSKTYKWNKLFIKYSNDPNLENLKNIYNNFDEFFKTDEDLIKNQIILLNYIFLYFNLGKFSKIINLYIKYLKKSKEETFKTKTNFIFNTNILLCIIEISILLNKNEFSKNILNYFEKYINDTANYYNDSENIFFDEQILNYLNDKEIFNQNLIFNEMIRLINFSIFLNEGFIDIAKKNLDDFKSMYTISSRTKNSYKFFTTMKKIYNMSKVRYDYLNNSLFKSFKHLNSLTSKYSDDILVKLYYNNSMGIINLKNKNYALSYNFFNLGLNNLKGNFLLNIKYLPFIKYNISLCFFYSKKYEKCFQILDIIKNLEIYKNNPFIFYRMALCLLESTIQKNYNNKKNKEPLNNINDKHSNNKKNIDYNQKKYFYLNDIENKNDFIKCAKYFLKTINLTSNLLNKKIKIDDEFYNLEKELNLFKPNYNNQNKSIHFSTFLQIYVSSYLNLLYVLSIIGNYSQVIFYAEKFKTNKIINEYMKNNYKSKSIIFTINNYMMFSYIKLNQNDIKDNEIINDLYY